MSKLNIEVKGDLWFFNIGTNVPSGNKLRRWNACREYGFVSAGQTVLDVGYVKKLKPKDIICGYESGTGFISIGKILHHAMPINQFRLADKRALFNLPLVNMGDGSDKGLYQRANDPDRCEHVASVKWYEINKTPLNSKKEDVGYYAPRNTSAYLKEKGNWEDNYKKDAIETIENHFEVKFIFYKIEEM